MRMLKSGLASVVLLSGLFLVVSCGDNCPNGVNYTDPSCPGYIPPQQQQFGQNPYQPGYNPNQPFPGQNPQQPFPGQYQQPYPGNPYQQYNPNQFPQWGTACPYGPGSVYCYGYGYQYPPFYYAESAEGDIQ